MSLLALFSAGSNARGQLAIGNIDDAHRFTPCIFAGCVPGALPSNVTSIDQIACGANHTLVLVRLLDGQTELWGCGDGGRGQLGPTNVGDITDRDGARFCRLDLHLEDVGIASSEDYSVRLIAAGWETSYIVLSSPERSDIVLSMGADDFGNLGTGQPTSKMSRQSTSRYLMHIVNLRTIFPSESEQHGMILTVRSLAAGPHHTVAHLSIAHARGSLSETVLVGWGTSRHGQLGPLLAPSGRPLPFTSSPHTITLPAPGDMTATVLGNQHTVLLNSSGDLSCLGSNRKLQLHRLDTLRGVAQIGCTWNGTYALLRSGAVVATGSNTHSQLGRGTQAESPSTLAPVQFPFDLSHGQVWRLVCGSEHVLCIVNCHRSSEGCGGQTRRELWGWGWNEHGNLGTGGTDDVDVPVRIWPSTALHQVEKELVRYSNVVNVWAGCGTSWILIEGLQDDVSAGPP